MKKMLVNVLATFKRNRWLFSLSFLTRIPGLFREPANKANFE